MEKEGLITGIAHDFNIAKVVIYGVPDIPGTAARIFKELSKAQITMQMIVQSTHIGNKNDIAFTCSLDDAKEAKKLLEKSKEDIGIKEILITENLAKVSVVGIGMMTNPNIASRMFSILGENKINIDMISTSEITISVIIDSNQCELAVKSLAEEFDLIEK